jgi:hypothetical protein
MVEKFHTSDMKRITGLESHEDLLRLVATGDELLLTLQGIQNLMVGFLECRRTANELQQLADALECENVTLDETGSAAIASVLFELSAPEINGAIDHSRGLELMAQLEAAGRV